MEEQVASAEKTDLFPLYEPLFVFRQFNLIFRCKISLQLYLRVILEDNSTCMTKPEPKQFGAGANDESIDQTQFLTPILSSGNSLISSLQVASSRQM